MRQLFWRPNSICTPSAWAILLTVERILSLGGLARLVKKVDLLGLQLIALALGKGEPWESPLNYNSFLGKRRQQFPGLF